MSSVLPGERRLTIFRPGAARSGLASPSIGVGPREDHDARASSVVVAVPLSSMPPPGSTDGSLPGAVMVDGVGPALSSEATAPLPAEARSPPAGARGSRPQSVGQLRA